MKNKLYLSVKEFIEITGIPKSVIYKNIRNGTYPFYFPVGSKRYRIHVSHISSIMSGRGPAQGMPETEKEKATIPSVAS